MTTVEVVFFPLDKQLGLRERNYSEGIVQEAVWLSGRMGSYGSAEEVLRRIGKLIMSDSTLWRHVKQRGEAICEYEEVRQAEAMALPRQDEHARSPSAGADRMGVGMDGAIVHILGEGWKELKVGTVYEVEQRAGLDQECGATTLDPHAVNNSYLGHLGGPEYFGQLMWAEAKARGWEEARQQQTMGDGAKWIWNQADLHFPLSQRTVDWYHARDHLHEAAQLLCPDNQRVRSRWFNRAETMLFQGHAHQIGTMIREKVAKNDTLPADKLHAEATYFELNYKRMQYLEFREEGLPIGSGMVESAAKQFKVRFCGPGMRWSRPGLERLLPIRAAVLGQRFDELWESVFPVSLN